MIICVFIARFYNHPETCLSTVVIAFKVSANLVPTYPNIINTSGNDKDN